MTDDLTNSEFAQLLRDMADMIDDDSNTSEPTTDESSPNGDPVIDRDATIPSGPINEYGPVGRVTGIVMQKSFYVDRDGDIWVTDDRDTFDYDGAHHIDSDELQRLVAASKTVRQS